MSITTAKNAIYSLITASGPWTTGEVSSCDFGIIDSVSACGIVFLPEGESEIEQLTFRGAGSKGAQHLTWQFRGDLFIKFDGNSPCYMAKLYRGIDDIQETFAKSDRGQGSNTASLLVLSRITCNIAEMYEICGHDFGVVKFYFQEEEIDLGQ